MGWLYTNEDIDHCTRKQLVIKHLECDEPSLKCKVLYATEYGSVVYAALRVQRPLRNEERVCGIVCLTHIDRKSFHNFGIKEMDETMGPNYYGASPKLINMLSPTNNTYALQWRHECLNKPKVRPLSDLPYGTIIEVQTPIKRKVEVIQHNGKRTYKLLYQWARMSAITINRWGWKIISEPGKETV